MRTDEETRQHYPMAKLPIDIVSHMAGATLERFVRVKIAPAEPRIMKFRAAAAYRNTSVEEAVARVRAWRDDDAQQG